MPDIPQFPDLNPDSGEPDSPILPVVFFVTLGRPALDYMMQHSGLIPTAELRFTIIQELKSSAPHWMKEVVLAVSHRVLNQN